MADSQPQQAASGQQGPQLLRADDIVKLQCLPDDEKQKYRLAILNFWNLTQQHPPGSTEHTTARQKLMEWSQKLIYREKQYRHKLKQQQIQQQQQQQQGGNQSQGSPSNQAGVQNQNQSPVKQEQAPAEQPSAPQQAQQQQQPPQNQQNAGPSRPPASGSQAAPDPAILKHVQEFPIQVNLNSGLTIGTPEYDMKVKEYRNGYLNMLVKQGQLVDNRRKIAAQIEERQKQGQEVSPELMNMRARVEKEHNAMKERLENFRKLQRMWKDERERASKQGQAQDGQTSQTQGAASNAQQPSAQQQPAAPPNNMPTQPQVKDEPQIKIEGGQAPQAQQPNAQFNGQGNQQQQQQQQQQLPQQQNVQMPPNLQQQQQQPQARPPPAAHAQTMPPGQVPQFAQQQAHLQQHNRPQINPHQANAQQQHHQSNSPHPHSATGGQGPPVPLSHQAAVIAANRSYTDPQRTSTPLQQGGPGTFGSREREQLNNPKMPIPKQLHIPAPSPVHMGQARPTMSGPTNGAPGPMGQPVIPRPPPFQLEGEGDRVLSKRKLDELVRQVTGGSEDALTPEVEEAVMQLADDFVDNVISNACKLSKLRESSQLDIRDLQVVLERNYNIRIPGYASDEVRTVRKVVPAAGWVDKMKAVNAAKVMGGKADF